MAATADAASTTPPTTAAPGKAAAAAKPGGPAPALQVPKPHGVCAVSGRAIIPGERFMAAVRETAAGLERVDVATEHWAGFEKGDLLGYWQTVMPEPEQKKKVFVDDEVLCTLFERLADASEPVKINFRFVLGLILMRKRLIIYEDGRHDADGRDMWVVRMKGREERLDLIDPKLDEQQVTEVSQQLGEILNQEM